MKREELAVAATKIPEINHILKSAEKLYNAYWTFFYNRCDKTLFPYNSRSAKDIKGIEGDEILVDSGGPYGVVKLPICSFTDSEHLEEHITRYVKDEWLEIQKNIEKAGLR